MWFSPLSSTSFGASVGEHRLCADSSSHGAELPVPDDLQQSRLSPLSPDIRPSSHRFRRRRSSPGSARDDAFSSTCPLEKRPASQRRRAMASHPGRPPAEAVSGIKPIRRNHRSPSGAEETATAKLSRQIPDRISGRRRPPRRPQEKPSRSPSLAQTSGVHDLSPPID